MDTIKLDALEAKFAKCRILVLGDIMLDAYLYGDAARISPEAPVPIVHIHEEKHLLGGAGNVARNIASLGAQVTLVGLVGDDTHGTMLYTMLQDLGIEGMLCAMPGRCTTVKTRVVAQNQQMLRLDYEKRDYLNADDTNALLKMLTPLLDTHDILIISDYAKGVISPDFMQALREILKARPHLPWLVDPKPQHISLFAGATLITPNAKELAEATGRTLRTQQDIIDAGEQLRTQIPVEHVLATLGAQGMALFMPDKAVWHIPAVAQQVFDVTGAGDTVIATLALAMAAGSPVDKACAIANAAAGYAVSQFGAAALDLACLQKECAQRNEESLIRWA